MLVPAHHATGQLTPMQQPQLQHESKSISLKGAAWRMGLLQKPEA